MNPKEIFLTGFEAACGYTAYRTGGDTVMTKEEAQEALWQQWQAENADVVILTLRQEVVGPQDSADEFK